jgi:hypothetical protein
MEEDYNETVEYKDKTQLQKDLSNFDMFIQNHTATMKDLCIHLRKVLDLDKVGKYALADDNQRIFKLAQLDLIEILEEKCHKYGI